MKYLAILLVMIEVYRSIYTHTEKPECWIR